MSSTRTTARRAVLNLILPAAFAAFAITVLPAATASAAERTSARAACANRLCTEVRDNSGRCWGRDSRREIASCFIRRAAYHFDQPRRQAIGVAWRESRLNWRAINSSSGAAGLYQFMPRTWRYTPYRDKSVYSPRWAALAAMWMWKKGYQSHWSTY
jgi:soluble lytic murein transglycosylase-like protein